jgi:chromosome segregation ATPase
MDPTPVEADALRIQAAAVAAQQAALVEDEMRVRKQHAIVAQQEAQLAALLNKKRRRLIALRDGIRQARRAFHNEREAQNNHIAESTRQIEAARAEIADDRDCVRNERRRLLQLRDRMRRRWHRHWAKERQAISRQQSILAEQALRLEQEREHLAAERQDVRDLRLQLNAEVELTRREVEDAWSSVDNARAKLQTDAAALARREESLSHAQRELDRDKRHWQRAVVGLQKEAQGLENRIENHRLKLREIELKAGRLTGHVPARGPTADTRLAVPEAGPPAAADADDNDDLLRARARALETLADALADQRLQLAEQWQRLYQAQEQWAQERDLASAQLENLAGGLQERERAVEHAELEGRKHTLESERQYRYVHALQAQWTARLSAWHGERERLIADLRSREETLARSQAAAGEMLVRWQARYQQAAIRLKAEYAECEAVRRQYAGSPPALQETLDLDARYRQLKQWSDELASKDAELVNLLATVEHGRSKAETESMRLHNSVRALRAQHAAYERQVTELSAEIERLARLVMADEGGDSFRLPYAA